tara:strand:+ start:918 stop:1106 length:189 start_codon:yes stop_codon:yes gene_type:complete
MGKAKNKKTEWCWEFFDRRGNLRHLGNWYKRYKAKRTTDTKHKKNMLANVEYKNCCGLINRQ